MLLWWGHVFSGASAIGIALSIWFVGHHFLPYQLLGFLPVLLWFVFRRCRSLCESESDHISTLIRGVAGVGYWLMLSAISFAVAYTYIVYTAYSRMAPRLSPVQWWAVLVIGD
jgi:hypothetical protein